MSWRFLNVLSYCLRRFIIGFMLISLNVVSMAVEFFVFSRRFVIRLRRRVIGIRFLLRVVRVGCVVGVVVVGVDFFVGVFVRCFFIFLRVRRLFISVFLMALASRLCLVSRRRIVGFNVSLFCFFRDVCWRCVGVDVFFLDLALVFLSALLFLRRRLRI